MIFHGDEKYMLNKYVERPAKIIESGELYTAVVILDHSLQFLITNKDQTGTSQKGNIER